MFDFHAHRPNIKAQPLIIMLSIVKDFLQGAVTVNLKKIGILGVFVCSIYIAYYWRDEYQQASILEQKGRLKDCEEENHHKDSAISALYDRLINKSPQ